MKRQLVNSLRCLNDPSGPRDGAGNWDLEIEFENEREIREGKLRCLHCGKKYVISEGILHMLKEDLPEEVAHEKEHAESFGYLVTQEGEKHPINRETLQTFRRLFLSLPGGDGSHFFKPGGSFDNQAGNAGRFFKTLDRLQLTGKEKVLEVGASFGWGAWRFAQRGCEVVALDVTNYLMAADLYMEEDGAYFERVTADMSRLPFEDGTFDLVFSHSVIHHCKELPKLFAEFFRVLRPSGRVVALHECAFGVFEDRSGKALQEAIHEGFNENAYTLPEWKAGAQGGGFKDVRLHFFSVVDDYIDRKQSRNAPLTWKLKLAYWIRSKPRLHAWLNRMSAWPRVLLRPKGWLLVATKLALVFSFWSLAHAEEAPLNRVFQVRATAVKAYYISDGKVKKESAGSEAVYEVNLPEKKIKRMAFYNPEVKEGSLSGLQANDIQYDIVHYKHDFLKDQLVIKGIGMVEEEDGFETLVIGEDFVTTSRSTKGFFELTHFDRTDAAAQEYQIKKGLLVETPSLKESEAVDEPKRNAEPSRRKALIPSRLPRIFRWREND